MGESWTRSIEMGVVRDRLVAVLQEIDDKANDGNDTGDGNSPAEGVANETLYVGARIVHKEEWVLGVSRRMRRVEVSGNFA